MQKNKRYYGQNYISSFFTNKNKNKNNTIKFNLKTMLTSNPLIFDALVFPSTISITVKRLVFTIFISLASINSVNASVITAEMSPEVAAEFNKQLSLQTWPEMHTKLALMDNPYKVFDKATRKVLAAEAEAGQKRRLMTKEESMIKAQRKRFDYCQASVGFFVDFAERAHTLSTVEDNPLSKDKLMQGNGIKYPFTPEETNNPNTRPAQIALSLGWDYRGKGKANAETFLKSCLAIPISLYYKEDKL